MAEEHPLDNVEVVDHVEEATPPERKQRPTERPRGGWKVMDDPTLSEDAKRYISRQRYHRGEAERKAGALETENRALRERLDSANRAQVEAYEGSLKSQLTQAKTQLKAANEAGDPDAMVEASEKLTQVVTEMENLNRMKSGTPATPSGGGAGKAETAGRPSFSPNTARWMEENGSWYLSDSPDYDRASQLRAEAIHWQLIEKEGFTNDSPEYFEELDRRIDDEMPDLRGARKERPQADTAEEDGEDGTAATSPPPPPRTPPRSSAATVAGAARTAATQAPQPSRTKVVLTSDERDLAKQMGITPEAYAKQKLLRMRQQQENR